MRRSLSDFAPLLPGDEGLPEILEEIRGELSVGVAWRELGTGKVIGCLALDRPNGLSGEPLGGGGGLFVGSAAFLWAAAGGKPPEGPLS